MADQDRERPSLELPSFRRGRKKRIPAADPPPEPAPSPGFETVAAQPPQPPAERETPPPEPVTPELFDEERTARPKREFRLPTLAGPVAAAVTGLVVGLLAVGLTWLLLRGCELVSGTSSCGNPGLLLLVALAVALGLLGTVLLRVLGVLHPGSTSALAVGLLAVVAMLFLIDVLFAWWMVVVIPLVAAGTYALAQVVTTAADSPA